jgi:hypothetical protein
MAEWAVRFNRVAGQGLRAKEQGTEAEDFLSLSPNRWPLAKSVSGRIERLLSRLESIKIAAKILQPLIGTSA